MTWLAREDAQQMLWQAIAGAHIEDGDAATLAWQQGLAELSPQERSKRVGEILSSNPAILEGWAGSLRPAFRLRSPIRITAPRVSEVEQHRGGGTAVFVCARTTRTLSSNCRPQVPGNPARPRGVPRPVVGEAVLSTTPVRSAKPLNDRQLTVLRWIAARCPERDWPDESHKHSARALESRGLAHVARRHGVRTPPRSRTRHATTSRTVTIPLEMKHLSEPAMLARERHPGPAALAPPGQLRRRCRAHPSNSAPPCRMMPSGSSIACSAADGRLEVEMRQHGVLSMSSGRRLILPTGMLVRTQSRGWYHQLVYLRDDPRAVVREHKVHVPSRLAKPTSACPCVPRGPRSPRGICG